MGLKSLEIWVAQRMGYFCLSGGIRRCDELLFSLKAVGSLNVDLKRALRALARSRTIRLMGN